MPVHDWTLVEAGIFHNMHVAWIPEISKRLNSGLLPEGYYSLVEQHAGRSIPDVLTLHGSPPPAHPASPPPDTGGIAVAEALLESVAVKPLRRRHWLVGERWPSVM